ncbi:MAG: helix-turn-helix transcriptional regulator [Bacteroidales bacterium]|nr:helix-turn-helix transcriptional regulator [Bacteroidales bacterium]HPD95365.1 S24 family peptidase [Tenuifilaceae bacterium]HRX30951.1 S24 family peptidase [Tenuifilaceae bacterium]
MMKKKSLIKNRILQYLTYKGISKYNFYKETGIARGVLDQNNGITEDNIQKFLAFAQDISPSWLLTGSGNMLKSQFAFEAAGEPIRVFREEVSQEVQRIPLYSLESMSGVIGVFEELRNQAPLGYISIPNLPNADGAIYMSGNSMYPLLKAGDIVIYKILNDKANIFWGEMYVLSIVHQGDSYLTVKRVQKGRKFNQIKLVSQNPSYQEKLMPFDAVKTVAHVVASISFNTIY